LTRGQEIRGGVVAIAPLLLGAVPFGLIYGVLAVKAGMTPLMAFLASVIIFAGSAQFMLTQLVAAGTPAALIVLSIFIINLRHALYSAALAEQLKRLPVIWRGTLAYFLTDEAYAAVLRRFEAAEEENRHWFFLSAAFTMWLVWQLSVLVGLSLGGQIPASWSLDFAGTLTFIAIVVPLLKDRATRAAMVAAGLVSIAAFNLPFKLAIIVAALAGMVIGTLVDRSSWSNNAPGAGGAST
jgi:4-azaleucine resistance transporter AzlC